MRLTDLSVKAFDPPKTGQKIHFDDGLPNFGIRLSYGGSRSWVVIVGAKRQLKTIGRYPDMTLKQARSIAKKLIATPPPPDLDTPPQIKFEEAVERFFVDNTPRLSTRTVKDYRYAFSRYFPFEKKSLHNISSGDVRRILLELRDKPSQQRLAFSAIRTFYNWAQRNELITDNIISTIPTPTLPPSRERILTEEELTEVYRASLEHPHPYGSLVRLLILTGQRRSEIASLKWDWINFEKRLITFPSEVMKNRRVHVLPLEATALSILETIPHLNEFVFSARGTKDGKPAPFSGWSYSKKTFDTRLNAVEPYTLHDLRRTFSSLLAMLGTPIHVTEKLLNHRSGAISGIAAVYNRYDYMDEQRQALRALEAHLEKLTKI